MILLENRIKNKNNNLRRGSLVRIGAATGILAGFLLIYIFAGKSLNSLLLQISSYGIEKTISVVGELREKVVRGYKFYINNQELEQENLRLKLELSRYKDISTQLYNANLENHFLKKQLKYVETTSPAVTAKVVAIVGDGSSAYLIIKIGSMDAVKLDQIVTQGDVLLGRIVEISQNYSKVMLLSDEKSRIPVALFNQKSKGIMVGRQDSNFSLLHAVNVDNLRTGDMLYTAEGSKYYPPGLKVGRVGAIIADNVMVESIVDVSKLKLVSIIY